jgi:hypothetical protein
MPSGGWHVSKVPNADIRQGDGYVSVFHKHIASYSITSSTRPSSVGETETAGPRRNPMTELLRQYSPEPKSA